jgi:hypothetical protein
VEKLKLKYAKQQKYFGRFVQNTNHWKTKTIDFLTFCFRGRGISSGCSTAFLPLSEKTDKVSLPRYGNMVKYKMSFIASHGAHQK